ncbi:MAG: hypothetical protein L3J66_06365 [Bacteroidales bacterium]|nr:hypothetical protein [Bacteroidales bacterium]
MNKSSLTENLQYGEQKPDIKLLFESNSTKEIRIVFRKGQLMKEHKTGFPITVEIFEGAIDFGVAGNISHLVKGDVVALPAGVPHDLHAMADSIVRLSLSKSDTVQRVKSVLEK